MCWEGLQIGMRVLIFHFSGKNLGLNELMKPTMMLSDHLIGSEV